LTLSAEFYDLRAAGLRTGNPEIDKPFVADEAMSAETLASLLWLETCTQRFNKTPIAEVAALISADKQMPIRPISVHLAILHGGICNLWIRDGVAEPFVSSKPPKRKRPSKKQTKSDNT
jgi:hypothetical protein